jgi:enoyl-CoA hydratase/carnithine racemase
MIIGMVTRSIINSTAFRMCSSKSNILIREDIAKTGISILTLNKPEKYNVLSSQMLDALRSELDGIAADEVLCAMRRSSIILYSVI